MRHFERRLFVLAAAAWVLVGCDKEKASSVLAGSGVPANEARDVAPFTRLSVGSHVEARVTIGPASKLEFRADKNLLPHVTSKVQNGELSLTTDQKVKPNIPIVVTFTVPRLDALSAVKGAKVSIERLVADKFEAKVVDGAKLHAAGSAKDLVLEGTGAGLLDFRKVSAASATVRLDKAARAEMGYLEKLNVNLNGASRVFYDGTPELKKELHMQARVFQRPQ